MADIDPDTWQHPDLVPRAGSELRDSHANLARALEASGIGTWTIGLGADTRMWWSPETCRILGLPPDAPIGREIFLGLLHPDEREPLRAALAQAVIARHGLRR